MKLKNSTFQTLLEVAALIALFAMWIYLITSWGGLPDKIPAHYNGAGEVDRWGSKAVILMLPIMGAGLYLLLTLITFFPSAWNVPVQITEKNRMFVYHNLKTLLIFIKLELVICFAYITYCDITLTSLGVWFLPSFLIVLFGTIIYYVVRIRRC